MFRYCLILIAIVATHLSLAAENPDIRTLMTEEEFAASGIGRLTEQEIEAINRWLVRYTVQDAEAMLENSPAVIEADNEAIRSSIDGQFNGWNGPTVFRLKNGQVWETRSARTYSYSAIDPEVEITKNWMGIFRMRILETGQAINVRRVE
ncbi:MAG: hypothetical protein MI746_09420 [Pseudomonadales bacterium]|nr:hypothetical protein [Pseudomonadales bacterium]